MMWASFIEVKYECGAKKETFKTFWYRNLAEEVAF